MPNSPHSRTFPCMNLKRIHLEHHDGSIRSVDASKGRLLRLINPTFLDSLAKIFKLKYFQAEISNPQGNDCGDQQDDFCDAFFKLVLF